MTFNDQKKFYKDLHAVACDLVLVITGIYVVIEIYYNGTQHVGALILGGALGYCLVRKYGLQFIKWLDKWLK